MDHFWLTDEQFAKIAPHLPTDTQGKARVDDRRVISGVVHVLKSGGRWTDAPREIYGPKKTLYKRFVRFVRWVAKGVWVGLFEVLAQAGEPPAQVLIDSSVVNAHRCAAGGARGEQTQAIGRSRGRRTTKIRALTDRACRALAFLLSGGQVAHCKPGALLFERLPPCRIVLADKGYDSDAIRRQIEAIGAAPNIAPHVNRRWKPRFLPCSVAAITPSSGCSGGSKTYVASPSATIGLPATTLLQSTAATACYLLRSRTVARP